MPQYQYKIIKDIPKWIYCPLCGGYDTKNESHFINHFNKCEDYEGHIDDIKDYYIDDLTTIGDFLEQKKNCIKITKDLIKTHELKNIESQSYNEIKQYIKNKLVINTPYIELNSDAINIYNFFFGECKESEEDFLNGLVEEINNRKDSSSS